MTKAVNTSDYKTGPYSCTLYWSRVTSLHIRVLVFLPISSFSPKVGWGGRQCKSVEHSHPAPDSMKVVFPTHECPHIQNRNLKKKLFTANIL